MTTLYDIAADWSCDPDGPLIQTTAASLLPVRRMGQALMIKRIDPQGDEAGAAAFLTALRGQGVVRLIRADGPWLLMERALPTGPGLAEMALNGQDDKATAILLNIAQTIHTALRNRTPKTLIPLDQRFRALWQNRRPLALWARQELAGKLIDRSDWQALHGDLHHFNVLHDKNRGWLAIDPKGLLGPPAYDLANTVLNPFPCTQLVHDPTRMAAIADQIANRLNITTTEMLTWVCLHGCLASAWGDQDSYWEQGARLAGRLAGLKLPD